MCVQATIVKEMKILDEQELTVRVEEIDNHLFSMHDTVNHAIIKVDEANPLSHFAVERIDLSLIHISEPTRH